MIFLKSFITDEGFFFFIPKLTVKWYKVV